MKIDLPGLLKERMPSGNYRYRVRVKGDKNRRITIYVSPDPVNQRQPQGLIAPIAPIARGYIIITDRREICPGGHLLVTWKE